MDSDSFILGVICLLFLQAFVVGILLLIDENTSNKYLGLFTLIYVHNSIKNTLPYELYEGLGILENLARATSSLFYFPILYFYVLNHIKQTPFKQIWPHFVLPSVVFIISIVYQLYLPELSQGQVYYYTIVNNFIILGVLVFYGAKTLRLTLKDERWSGLLLQVRKRIAAFAFFIFVYFLFVISWFLTDNFIHLSDEQNQIIQRIQEPFFYAFILLIPVYSYVCLNRFKRYIQPQKIIHSQQLQQDIEDQLNQIFKEEKLHHDKSFGVKNLSIQLGMSVDDLRILFTNKYKCSVTDFINKMRIEDFKTLSASENGQLYNIEGLAKSCGFNSRATFYRIFKQLEGMTPAEYMAAEKS